MKTQLARIQDGLSMIDGACVILDALAALGADDAPALSITLDILRKAQAEIDGAADDLRAINEVKEIAEAVN